MEEIEYDVTWDLRNNQHFILIDTGDTTIRLTAHQLREMLESLSDVEDSA